MNVESRSFLNDFFVELNNFSFYRMLPKSLLPINRYRPVTHEIFAYQNIVAIRKDVDKEA